MGRKNIYRPVSNLEIRLTRAPLQQICMGSQLPDNAVNAPDTQRLHPHVELDLPVYKLVEQLRQAINTMLTDRNEEAKITLCNIESLFKQ